MSAETVLLAPVFLLFLLFLVGAGRLVEAQGEVNGAARDAARAASVQRTQEAAEAAATDAVKAALEGQCGGPAVALEYSELPSPDGEVAEGSYGGEVQVEVTCDLDLAFLGWGATRTMTGTSVAPLELYRRFEGQ